MNNRTVIVLAMVLGTVASLGHAAALPEGNWTGGFWLDGAWVGVNVRFDRQNENGGTADILFPSYGGGENAINVPLGDLKDAAAGFTFTIPTRTQKVVFEGKQERDTITGNFAYEKDTGTFGLTRLAVVTVEPLQKYYGAYRIAPDHVISILRGWGSARTLNYVDYKTGHVGTLWPSSETEFLSGTGLQVSFPVTLRVSFERDANGNDTGLKWQPKDGPTLTAKRLEFKEDRITFTNGEITLGGTLIAPASSGRHAAIIITPGDFGTNRDQLRLWAHHYVSHGIAALIFDSRGAGESTGPVQSSSFSELANDVISGVHALKARDDINPRQIGLFGFSNSSWTVALAASRSTDVAFLIMQSLVGVEPWKQDVYRVETQLRVDGFPESEVKQGTEFVRRKFEVARTGEGWDELVAIAQDPANARWMPYTNMSGSLERLQLVYKAVMTYDPAPDLAKLKIPVLSYWGAKDTYLPVEESVAIFEKAMKKAGNKRYVVKVFPDGNHSAIDCETGSPSTGGKETNFPPGFWELKSDWLLEQLRARR